jgi:hypothetical protein
MLINKFSSNHFHSHQFLINFRIRFLNLNIQICSIANKKIKIRYNVKFKQLYKKRKKKMNQKPDFKFI